MILFETEKVTAISRLRVVATWSGLSAQTKRKSAVYTVPEGFAVLDIETIVLSSNNGSRSVSSLGEGLDLVTETEAKIVFEAGIEAAYKDEKNNIAANLKQKQNEFYKSIDKYRSNKSVVKANVEAQAHGSFANRKRGWEEISVVVKLIWLGGSSIDDLAASLEEEFKFDIPGIGKE